MRFAMVSLLGLLLVPAISRADGAFPADLQLFEPLDAPARTVVGTNYGLIFTEDDGAHWSYVCEAAISAQQVTRFALGADGTFYAASGSSVLRSQDHGCTWAASTLGGQADQVSDLFADPLDAARLYAIVYRGASFSILVSTDHGATFGPALLSGQLLLGVEAARSQAGRLYASGSVALDGGLQGPVVFVSDDGGGGYLAMPISGSGAFPFIAAVDPADADSLFVNLTQAGQPDRLAVSHDRGRSFTALLDAPTNFSGFAVGTDHTAYVADRSHHLWRFDPDGGTVALSGPSATCLATRGGVLDACGSVGSGAGLLARSTDRGASFMPLLTTRGYSTLDCPAVLQICGQVNPNPVAATSSGSTGSSGGPGTPRRGCGCEGSGDALSTGAALLGLSWRKARRRRSPGGSGAVLRPPLLLEAKAGGAREP